MSKCTCRQFNDFIFGGPEGKIPQIIKITDPRCPNHGWEKVEEIELLPGMSDGYEGWLVDMSDT